MSNSFPQRIGFAGTPEFAQRILAGLLAAGGNVVCVYTQPDRPSGRGRKLLPCAVKALAEDAGIEVRQPRTLRKAEARDAMAAAQLDVLVVAAYGLILPQAILDTPRLGCINVHASLLPRWRGAAPIERAIMAGDTQSGVSIMRMEAGLDTGGVYKTRSTPIGDQTTGKALHDELAELGSEALVATLENFAPDSWQAQDDSLATYADKLSSEDAEIDWHEPARVVARHINALNDRLPARSVLLSTSTDSAATNTTGEVVSFLRAEPASVPVSASAKDSATPGTILERSKKTISVATGAGAVVIKEVQLRRGKGKPMPMSAALNGYSELFEPGLRFTSKAETQGDESASADS